MTYPKRKPRKPKKRNPTDSKLLQRAKSLSKRFHGTTKVVQLSAKERKPLPKYVVVVGELDELTYAPGKRSQRGRFRYSHKTGDKGRGERTRRKPLLVVDPKTKKAAIVANRSGMRFSASRGFVG